MLKGSVSERQTESAVAKPDLELTARYSSSVVVIHCELAVPLRNRPRSCLVVEVSVEACLSQDKIKKQPHKNTVWY